MSDSTLFEESGKLFDRAPAGGAGSACMRLLRHTGFSA